MTNELFDRPEVDEHPTLTELDAFDAAMIVVDGHIAIASQQLDDAKPVTSDALIQASIAHSLFALSVMMRAGLDDAEETSVADAVMTEWDKELGPE